MNAALAIAADIHIVLALGQHSSKQYDSSEKRGPTKGGQRPIDKSKRKKNASQIGKRF
jgi:hypothetical protein